MPVTDDQVDTLRALLTGQSEEYLRRFGQLDPEAAKTGFSALVTAGFFEAVYRRFAEEQNKHAKVVEFVGDLRARLDESGRELDARAAERLVLRSLGNEGSVADIDDKTALSTQMTVLAALILDEELAETDLEEFIREVRAVADDWTS